MMNLRSYSGKYHVAEKAANTIWECITSPYMGIDDARWFLKQAGNFEEYCDILKSMLDEYVK